MAAEYGFAALPVPLVDSTKPSSFSCPNPVADFIVVRHIRLDHGQTMVYITTNVQRGRWISYTPPSSSQDGSLSPWVRLYRKLLELSSSSSPSSLSAAVAIKMPSSSPTLCIVEDGNNDPARATVELDDTMCSICFEVMTECGELDKCQHRYCLSCLLQWSERRNWCPICHQDFVQVFKSSWRPSSAPASSPYKRLPMRCVFKLSDVRAHLAGKAPELRFRDGGVRFDASFILILPM